MFSRSKGSNLQKPRKLHSLGYLKYLYHELQKNCDSTEYNSEEVVESLRLFSEIIVWGDQNDESIMDFFWEQNALELLIRYIERRKDRNISIQLLQTLNIIFENLTNERAIYYLLSQNHINGIILYDFDFADEEVIGYYIAFLKALSFRVNEDTVNFFYDDFHSSFPLYQRALRFFNHSESMVRIAVRTITLNIFKVRHIPCSLYVYAHTALPYFLHLTEEIRKTASAFNESVCLPNRLAIRGRIEDLVAEMGDHLHYIDDIFVLGVPDLTNVLFLVLLHRLLLPVYVPSLTKRNPPSCLNAVNNNLKCIHTVAMFLLAQVFTILHQPELIRILTEAILIGDLTLLVPSLSPTTTANKAEESDTGTAAAHDNDVLAYLRAGHHGKRAIGLACPGGRLQAFLQTLTACGVTGDWSISPSLTDDIIKCSESIRNFLEKGRSANHQNQKGNQFGASSDPIATFQPSPEFSTRIAVPPAGAFPTDSQSHPSQSVVSATSENAGDACAVEGFSLTGKPFLRALFRSLEVGPGTDYDTFFALSLLIAIKRNGGLDEETLALAQLHTPSKNAPSNPMLVTKLLDIISDAAKMGSRVRVATLNLALFLLVLVTRDFSRHCQLTHNQRQQLEAAFEESRVILRDLYLTEPDFGDIFEYEVCHFRAQKFCPSKLLENSAFIFSHADDAFKLFFNRSEECLSDLPNPQDSISPLIIPPKSRNSLEGPPYTALPVGQLEHIQRIIAVYICLHGYLCTYIFTGANLNVPATSADPLNDVNPPALEKIPSFFSFGNIPPSDKVLMSVSDSIDTAEHKIFSCEVEHQNERIEKRYFIINDVQISLVEPSPRKIGWGVVTFCGLIQDTELQCDTADGRVLKFVVYKPGDRSGLTVRRIMTEMGLASSISPLPSMNAKLRFFNSFQCSTIYKWVTQSLEKIRSMKHEKLKQLLNVLDKTSPPCTQSIPEELSSSLRLQLPPTTLKPLKTVGSAPTTLLQKAGSSPLSSTAGVSICSPDTVPHTNSSKKEDEVQEIAMVDLSRKADTSRTPHE